EQDRGSPRFVGRVGAGRRPRSSAVPCPEPAPLCREGVQDLLAVPGELVVPDAADLAELRKSRGQLGRDLAQGRVMEDHICRYPLLVGRRGAPGPEPLEYLRGGRGQFDGRDCARAWL